jgi:hypothetical protein
MKRHLRKALDAPLALGVVGLTLILVLHAVLVADTSGAVPSRFAFEAVEVYLDTGDRPLAAFQFELTDPAGAARIVGVEGGAHPAFARPPYYDPAALQGGRIIIAAFSTGRSLPTGRTRIATLHMLIEAGRSPEYKINVEVAADAEGRDIGPTAGVDWTRKKKD